MKVGSSTVQKTNVRIVAATNVNIPKAIEEGKFREDLYYRLSTVGIDVPPLRDRGRDITLLARKFVADFAEKYRMPPIEFTPEAMDALERYRWPGNVRQLKNIVEQVCLFEAGNSISAETLESYLPANSMIYAPALNGKVHSPHAYEEEREVLFNMVFRLRNELDSLRAVVDSLRSGSPVDYKMDYKPMLAPVHEAPADPVNVEAEVVEPSMPQMPVMTLGEAEKTMIERSLEKHGGLRKAVAKELNISERTLYRKLKEYGLE